jgi:hypothetical protein
VKDLKRSDSVKPRSDFFREILSVAFTRAEADFCIFGPRREMLIELTETVSLGEPPIKKREYEKYPNTAIRRTATIPVTIPMNLEISICIVCYLR